MSTRAEDNLLDWLRDAHAMEEQAEKMLASTAARLENYPELKLRIEQHLEETRRQATLVRGCIERRGGDTSTVKDVAGRIVAMAQGLSGALVPDEVVKASMSSYAFEHMEIASYTILVAAAQVCEDVETQRVCEQILQEELAMAGWLAERMPALTRQFLQRDATQGSTAKH